MKRLGYFWWAIIIAGCDPGRVKDSGTRSTGYGITPVPFHEVILDDDFWKLRLEIQSQVLVPFALDKTLPAVEALQKAGDFLDGDTNALPTPHRYRSSDLYKVMEGASYVLKHNPGLENRMDEIIDIIANAQKEDGYLYVAHITGVSKDHDHWGGGGMGDKPYSWVFHSHELYNMGHMYEAAIAYYQATGKDRWLKIAEKNAQHINRVFFEGDPDYNDGKPVNQAPGHQELEIALTKMYRVTGNELYLDMAKKFLDIRGKTFVPEGEGYLSAEYAQQHLPVAEQRKAVGHAVRAAYMYSGMADVGALSGVDDYEVALKSIWHDLVDTKMSITGGLGAVRGIEGFGPSYVLPNKEAYNETCAAVGNVFFNFRMFLMSGDAGYMDVAEVSLLNNALAGVSLEGNRFFYVNPLESDGMEKFNHGQAGRSPWFNTACCPSNIARLIPQVSGMMYAYTGDAAYITFYGSSKTTVDIDGSLVPFEQTSNYPFDGKIKINVMPEREMRFKLKLRIPTWARTGQFVPGELYHFADEISERWTIMINDTETNAEIENGFATIDRVWSNGDQVALNLPMPVRFNRSIEEVEANRDRIAVTRGPLVYCAEEVDNGGPVQRFTLDPVDYNRVDEQTIIEGVLKSVVTISFPASSGNDRIERLKLVPYYTWNNRGDGSMIVWLPAKKIRQ